MNTRPIRFFHRGAVVEVSDAAPTRSVLDWLREDARCTGTKEGCNEGDCGACTVVIGTPAAAGDPSAVRGMHLETANACIQFLPTLDGKALFTIEDLKTGDGQLHPVQEAMVECHGSQCGFCTPGFVMSMWSTYERHCERGTTATRQQLADDLSGNLCRCTGYRPIIDAGQRMFELPKVRIDTAPVLAALAQIAPADTSGAFSYSAPHPSMPRTPDGKAPVHQFHAPRTVDALAELCEAKPDARILAGSTDIGLWVNKGFRNLPELIYVGEVGGAMKEVTTHPDGAITIGAGASLEQAWAATCKRHPSVTDMWLRFASLPIRNAGTMGGSVANGSPIGDSAPVLISLDATIVLRKGARVRRMLLQDFYVDYMKNRREPGEFVLALELPALPAARQVRAYKISKRFDCDITAVCGGFAIELDGDTVREIRLVFGGMAAICKRAPKAEAAIAGRPWNEATLREAQAALDGDFTPMTDMRASKEYRAQVARNLLERLWLETRRNDPLDVTQTSVFASLAHDVI
ncbi:MAG: xanthine dehydrogenase small subunit [Proteobacteria bacterium]|nr:xanthine dehydrogenase small subunit [Pseudomonadota bacterium]